MDKYTEKLKNLIDTFGFEKTLEMTSFSPIELLKQSNYKLDSDFLEDIGITLILKQLIKLHDNYKECTLNYVRSTDVIDWICEIKDNKYIYRISAYATPYYFGMSIPIETDGCIRYNKGDMSNPIEIEKIIGITIPAPSSFENIDSFIEWYMNTYLPITYKQILKHLEKYKVMFDNK